MIELFKALPFGGLLTWIVALFIGSAGSRGGFLSVRLMEVSDYSFHWSWPLFLAGTALAWAMMAMQR